MKIEEKAVYTRLDIRPIKMYPLGNSTFYTGTTTSTRPVHEMRGIHLFRIEGYSTDVDRNIGERIESPEFIVGGYRWTLFYYP
jgi:hypothetical protein